jgi:hypothetical protein
MKRLRFRKRWLGHKHGPARGVAVFGASGKGGPDWSENLELSCGGLRKWSREHGLNLDDGPESLKALDERLDSWNFDATDHGQVDLANEVGIYLGTVIIKNLEGSKWRVWPNGHPVVLLHGGRDFDVTRFANDRLNHSGAGLVALYDQARSV